MRVSLVWIQIWTLPSPRRPGIRCLLPPSWCSWQQLLLFLKTPNTHVCLKKSRASIRWTADSVFLLSEVRFTAQVPEFSEKKIEIYPHCDIFSPFQIMSDKEHSVAEIIPLWRHKVTAPSASCWLHPLGPPCFVFFCFFPPSKWFKLGAETLVSPETVNKGLNTLSSGHVEIFFFLWKMLEYGNLKYVLCIICRELVYRGFGFSAGLVFINSAVQTAGRKQRPQTDWASE